MHTMGSVGADPADPRHSERSLGARIGDFFSGAWAGAKNLVGMAASALGVSGVPENIGPGPSDPGTPADSTAHRPCGIGRALLP